MKENNENSLDHLVTKAQKIEQVSISNDKLIYPPTEVCISELSDEYSFINHGLLLALGLDLLAYYLHEIGKVKMRLFITEQPIYLGFNKPHPIMHIPVNKLVYAVEKDKFQDVLKYVCSYVLHNENNDTIYRIIYYRTFVPDFAKLKNSASINDLDYPKFEITLIGLDGNKNFYGFELSSNPLLKPHEVIKKLPLTETVNWATLFLQQQYLEKYKIPIKL